MCSFFNSDIKRGQGPRETAAHAGGERGQVCLYPACIWVRCGNVKWMNGRMCWNDVPWFRVSAVMLPVQFLSFVDSLIHVCHVSLIYVQSHVHSLTHSFTWILTDLLIHIFHHSLTLTYSLTLTSTFIYSLIRPLTYNSHFHSYFHF